MRNKSKILSAIIIVAIVFFIGKFAAKPIKNTFHIIFAPAENTFFQAAETTTGLFGSLLNAKQLESQNKQLLKEHFALTQENEALKAVEQENNVLKQALDINETNDFEFAIAEVISKQIISDVILINSGRNSGLLKDMIVITPESILVGKIVEVFQDFAQVVLISTENNSFDIKIKHDEQEILGAAKGTGNFQMTYGLVLKDETIKIGDKIFTIALGGNFPQGFLVGEVSAVRKTDAAPYQTGIIAPYFNRVPLNNVLIIKNFVPIVQ